MRRSIGSLHVAGLIALGLLLSGCAQSQGTKGAGQAAAQAAAPPHPLQRWKHLSPVRARL